MTKTLVSGIATIAIGLLVSASNVSAQSIGASAMMMDARHELLDGDLFGGTIDVRLPVGRRSAIVRLGATRLVGTGRRTDGTCVGLIMDPEACLPEPVRDATQFTTMSAGLSDRLAGWRGVTVDLGADLRAGVVDVATRGQTSGRRLSGDRWLWGADIALDVAWSPWARLPVALEIGATAGGIKPFVENSSYDNYEPFGEAFGITTLRVGASWRRAVSAR